MSDTIPLERFDALPRGGRLVHESTNSKVFHEPTSAYGVPVVVKVLNREYPSAASIRHFYNELEILEDLEIVGVRRALSIGKERGRHALVLEWVDGETVRTLARREPFDLRTFVWIAAEVARILGDVHSAHVIHRDVSGLNLLYQTGEAGERGRVVLIDFGIASRVDIARPHLGHPERLEGNLSYLSPEQTGRMNRVVDHRTDLYSLGVTCFEMLTGRLPFESSDALELVHAHIAQPPPRVDTLRDDVPGALSAIVDRLLAKNPEDRYQSAFGLEHDLRRCLEIIEGDGSLRVQDFEIGRRDYSGRLPPPARLYGRESEVRELLDAFDRVADGGIETFLVGGYSGTGKSALVHEILEPITERRGYFLEGKFDQYQRAVPYDALLQAFDGLVETLLTEREEDLAAMRERLREAVGSEGRLLTDVLGGLEHVLGPQPEVAEVGGQEAKNRFHYVFRRFVAAIATAEHPIVLFIDDLQWADSASLGLLQALMTDPDGRHLLTICAYRDNEVDKSHPFAIAVRDIDDVGAVTRVELQNLSHDDVHALVSDTLLQPDEVEPLVALVYEKTRGNAFFVVQFCRSLYREGLLRFDFDALRWVWEIDKIRGKGITDNVVELMAGRVRRLPAAARDALCLAASIGNAFDLQTLAVIREATPQATRRVLRTALVEGLLLPEEDTFRFAHDRIQQAVYSLVPESERAPLHLQIGRLLLAAGPKLDAESTTIGEAGRLFDIVTQLNAGAAFMDDPGERVATARLNLRAGLDAKQASAFDPAFDFFVAGLDLLAGTAGLDAWREEYELSLALHEAAAEMAYNRGEHEVMDDYLDTAVARARSLHDTVRAYALRLNARKAQNRLQEAIDLGLEVLAKLGERFPERPLTPLVLIDLARTKWMLRGLDDEAIVNLPEMTDPKALAAMRILNNISSPVYWARPQLLPFVLLRMLQLCLRHGVTRSSAFSFSAYGLLLCGALGAMREGYRFGQLALRLLDRFDAKEWLTQTYTPIYALINHWNESVHESLDPLIDSYRVGLETGAIEYACINANIYCIHALLGGRPLVATEEEMRAYSRRIDEYRQETNFYYNEVYRQAALCLLGRSDDPTVLDGDAYDRSLRLAQSLEREDRTGTFHLHFLELVLGYLFARPARAFASAEAARPLLDAVLAKFEVPNYTFYSGLAALALLAGDSSSEISDDEAENPVPGERLLWRRAKESLKNLRKWAATAPENYLHKLHLLEAEQHRVLGRDADARLAYDRAITEAGRNRYPHEEALACERAAHHTFALGADTLAEHYLKRGYQSWREWGAEAKLHDLAERFPRVLTQGHRKAGAALVATATTTDTTHLGDGSLLDLGSVMKASTAISGEIVLADLLRTLMEIVIENAGAQRGVLLLRRGERFLVEAAGGVDQPVEVLQSVEIDGESNASVPETCAVPVSVVHYVARTLDSVVVDDAAEQGAFLKDPHVRRCRPRSLLGLPLVDRGLLVGVLYLEHAETAGAFDAERMELLSLLSGQIAISIDKALLLENLEEKVRERTADVVQEKENVENALARLEATQAQLVQAEKMASLGEMTAGIAHEIKNPLNFVNNFAAISSELCHELRELLGAGEGEIAQILDDLSVNSEQIVRHGQRANAIVRAMMQHAIPATGERRRVELNEFVAEQLDLAFHSLRARENQPYEIELLRDFDPELGEVSIATPEMARVLVNLLDNAFDAVRTQAEAVAAGDEPYRPRVRVITRALENGAEIRVEDNGPGVPEEIAAKIFEPFFTTKAPGSGNTGLGLSLSYDIVTHGHGGSLVLEPAGNEAGGATFRLGLKS